MRASRIHPVAATWLIVTAAALTSASAADVSKGEKLFVDCATCHTVERGVNGVGPSLFGVFGRKAGDVEDFRYSPALKRSGIVWSPQTLGNYLADPQKAVPGNRMPYSGMPNAQDRADLIAYLQAKTK